LPFPDRLKLQSGINFIPGHHPKVFNVPCHERRYLVSKLGTTEKYDGEKTSAKYRMQDGFERAAQFLEEVWGELEGRDVRLLRRRLERLFNLLRDGDNPQSPGAREAPGDELAFSRHSHVRDDIL